jgi:hypothetical protein
VPRIGTPGLGQRHRQLERGLPAELHDHAPRLLPIADRQHVLERERLEVQPVRGVVVGRHRLGVAVDHDRLEAQLLERHRRVDAAVVELDALADAVGAAAEDDHLARVGRVRLALVLVGRVEVRRVRLELGGAGVDPLVDRDDARGLARGADLALGGAGQGRDAPVRQPAALVAAQGRGVDRREPARGGDRELVHRHRVDLAQEPRIDPGQLVGAVEAEPELEAAGELEQPLGAGHRHRALEAGQVVVHRAQRRVEAGAAGLERADGLAQRLAEGAADRHRLADRLHLRAQRGRRGRELLEREARPLHDDVVDGRLERRRRGAGDVVLQLVERVADRELGGDLGDREAGGLRRQRRAARHARVHLDDQLRPVAGSTANCTLEPPVSTPISRMIAIEASRMRWYSLSVSVIAGATVIESPVCTPIGSRFSIEQMMMQLSGVAHHLELVLLPAEHALLDEHLVHRRHVEAANCTMLEALARCTRCRRPSRPA